MLSDLPPLLGPGMQVRSQPLRNQYGKPEI
jgi:hypothetical protein